VKLGKTAKLSCDRVCGNEKVKCRLEVTVKEYTEDGEEKNKSVDCAPPPPPRMPSCGTSPVMPGCCATYDGCKLVEQATYQKEKKVEFTPRRITVCDVPRTSCGKVADAEGACKMLEVIEGAKKTTCEKLTLTECCCLDVSVSV